MTAISLGHNLHTFTCCNNVSTGPKPSTVPHRTAHVLPLLSHSQHLPPKGLKHHRTNPQSVGALRLCDNLYRTVLAAALGTTRTQPRKITVPEKYISFHKKIRPSAAHALPLYEPPLPTHFGPEEGYPLSLLPPRGFLRPGYFPRGFVSVMPPGSQQLLH